MFAFLFSKVGAYLVGTVVVASLVVGGYWYVSHLRAENALMTRQLAGYKRAMQIIKDDLKQDREDQDEKDKIDAFITPDQFVDYFKQLRQRARDTSGTDPGNAGD